MGRRIFGFGPCVATVLLAACGGDTESDGASNSDAGSSGESGVNTGGVETGGMGGAGAVDPDGSAVNSASAIYRGCRWETDPQTIVVSRWDSETCLCTRLKLEDRTDCAFPVQAGAWCVQEAQVTNDVANCEHEFSATGTEATEAMGSVSLSMTDPWQADVGVTLTLDSAAGLPQLIEFEINDCWLACADDCGARERAPAPTVAAATVRSYCGDYYEIEIADPAGFYIGALDWVLDIGGTVFSRYRFGLGGSTYALLFRISVAEFDALTDGAPITAWYGNPGSGRGVDLGVLDKALVESG